MIGIITAMESELNNILKELDLQKKYTRGGSTFYLGYINKKSVCLVLSGVGKINAAVATTLMIESGDIDLVINSGIAGGFLPLETTNIIIPKDIYYSDVNATNFGYKPGQVPGMPAKYSTDSKYRHLLQNVLSEKNYEFKNCDVYSGDSFIAEGVHIEEYVPKTNIALEMEGGAIAQTCYKFGVPFVSVRFISDVIGSNNHLDNYRKFESSMARMSADICLTLINNL